MKCIDLNCCSCSSRRIAPPPPPPRGVRYIDKPIYWQYCKISFLSNTPVPQPAACESPLHSFKIIVSPPENGPLLFLYLERLVDVGHVLLSVPSFVSLQFLIKVIMNFHKEHFQIESCHPPPAAWSVWEPVSCWGAPQSCPRQLPPGVYHACPGAHHQHPAERSGFSSCLSTKWEVWEIWDSMEIILCLRCTRKDRPSTVEYIIRHFFLL